MMTAVVVAPWGVLLVVRLVIGWRETGSKITAMLGELEHRQAPDDPRLARLD
jgi:hypothetical protein